MKTAGQCVLTFLFCYITLGLALPYALLFSIIDLFLDLGKHRRGPVYIPSRVTHEPYSAIMVALGVATVLSLILRSLKLLDLTLIEVLILGTYVGVKHWLLDIATVPGAYVNGRLLYLTVLRDDGWYSTATCLIATLLLFLKLRNIWLLPILLPLSLEPNVYLPIIAVLYVIDLIVKAILHVSLFFH